MFQFEDVRPARPRLSAAPLKGLPGHGATHRALLAWAEHCVECAAPACYSSCDLYDPTPAGKCRRFEGGIVRARGVNGAPAAEVKFKRWGKLEAQGNAALLPSRRARMAELLLGAIARPANKLGVAIARATGSQRWATPMEALHKRINAWLQKLQNGGALPNAFVADIFNPEPEPVTLILSAFVDKLRLARPVPSDQLPRPMTVSIVAHPGATQHIVPTDGMRDIMASGLPFNIALSPASDGAAHLVFGTLDLIRREEAPVAAASAPQAEKRAAAKCVIFDLDNTLWDGILLEGDVVLRDGIEALFRALDERGVLISVASKNARDDAMARLRQAGLDEYLLHPQIGWAPKSESVRQIAKSIDIGADTLIFVDDNPFERAEVAQAVPGVEVLPETAIATLIGHPRLQGAVTAESKQRRKMYQQAIAREQTAAGYGDDYLAFLRDCEIRTEIRRDAPHDFDRIVELVQRTNQLNFSGRKYGREEIIAILEDGSRDRHVVTVSDKFGSYGTVGFCLSSRAGDTVTVEDFMLSCRVQGKFVEQALFWFLTVRNDPTVKAIEVNFKRTERNGAAEMVLEKLGFAPGADGKLRLELTPESLAVDFMTIE